jgi:hypothetical protein
MRRRRAQAVAEFALVVAAFVVLTSSAIAIAPAISARNEAFAVASELLDRSTRYVPPDPANRFPGQVDLADQIGPLCKWLTLAGRELLEADGQKVTLPSPASLTSWGSDPGTSWCQPTSALSASRTLTVDIRPITASGTLISDPAYKMTTAERAYRWSTSGNPIFDANGQQATYVPDRVRYQLCVGVYWLSPSPIIYAVTEGTLFRWLPLGENGSLFKFSSCSGGTLSVYRGS